MAKKRKLTVADCEAIEFHVGRMMMGYHKAAQKYREACDPPRPPEVENNIMFNLTAIGVCKHILACAIPGKEAVNGIPSSTGRASKRNSARRAGKSGGAG